MGLLQNLRDMLGENTVGTNISSLNRDNVFDGLSNMFKNSGGTGPAVLGGLVGALLSSKAARGIAGGALLAGGGSMIWNKLKERIEHANVNNPQYGRSASGTDERAERIVRALVYAAKSDGNMDESERRTIMSKLSEMGIDGDARALVKRAMDEPLSPEFLAAGVKSADEALELFTISSAAVTGDSFMERNYLDALAKALKIPDDVKNELESKIKTPA